MSERGAAGSLPARRPPRGGGGGPRRGRGGAGPRGAAHADGGAVLGSPRGPVVATLSVAEALSGGRLEGFARAEAPRDFVFPRDHGPHPEFRAEWWYWTGNLRTAEGRHLGFQLTFFRSRADARRAGAAARTGAPARPISRTWR